MKLMMMRTTSAQQVKGLEHLKLVASACFSAKNKLCNKMGMSPMQAVTGRDVLVPTSIMDQLCSVQLKLAKNATLDEREAMRKAECIRAAAVDSFNWIDSNEVIRRGPRTTCTIQTAKAGDDLKGMYTSFVRIGGQPRQLQDYVSWNGPGLAVCVERQQNVPNRIWVRIEAR